MNWTQFLNVWAAAAIIAALLALFICTMDYATDPDRHKHQVKRNLIIASWFVVILSLSIAEGLA